MKDRATQLALQIQSTGLFKTPNYTRLSADNRYVVGYLGEFAVASAMEGARIKYFHHIKVSGRSEPNEFVVWVNGQRSMIEVKTASQPWHQYFAMPASQRLDGNVFIGVRLDGDYADIMGWLTREEVEQAPVSTMRGHSVDTRMLPYRVMRPLNDLVRECVLQTADMGQ